MTTIWTDGGCWPNPGKGGWGWTDLNGNQGSGGENPTTNQRMEMTAAVRALEWFRANRKGPIKIVSDSMYVINGCTDWRAAWIRRGWTNSAGKPVANRDLWEPLHVLVDELRVEFEWVRGHTGDPGNEAADRLATVGSGCTPQEIGTAERRLKELKRYVAAANN